MKKIKYILLFCLGISFSSCNNWLDVLPQNAQVTDKYWASKEEVEAVLATGYIRLRATVEDYLIPWGELRGSSIYARTGNVLQYWQVTPSSKAACNWGPMYEVINMANSVLDNVDAVLEKDATFAVGQANSFKCEAYFLRSLAYFYLVRNFKEVPLILSAYTNDKLSYEIAKSPEDVILAQIKQDLTTAIASGAAKTSYEDEWATKGRATLWALHALLADICLWSEDYEGTMIHCNAILDATDAFRPALIQEGAKWFDEIFYTGNSNESIFEIQWDYPTNSNNLNKLQATVFGNASPTYAYSQRMHEDLIAETQTIQNDGKTAVRTLYTSWLPDNIEDPSSATLGYIWKYSGNGIASNPRSYSDANFIIYRMADVYLMKAEALIQNSESHESWEKALELINQIRVRANLKPIEISNYDEIDRVQMLEYLLSERNMEFAAEGKRWYDLLRLGKARNFENKETFLVSKVLEYNHTVNSAWVRSVLSDNNALYLPIWATEIENNHLLVQNPYYGN